MTERNSLLLGDANRSTRILEIGASFSPVAPKRDGWNCVVVDHGQGLLSLYLHFSEIKVKEGDQVARGQLIGRSGATGRVTGPHLHVAFRWQGVYFNPATLLGLRLP